MSLPGIPLSSKESLCEAKNLSLGISVQVFLRSQGRADSLFAWGPCEGSLKGASVCVWICGAPFILPLPSCRTAGLPTSITLARKVVTGLCFLLCVLFLCLVNRVSMETGAAFVLLLLWVNQCSPPPPLFGIKGGGGLITETDRGPCGGLGAGISL